MNVKDKKNQRRKSNSELITDLTKLILIYIKMTDRS